MDPSALLLKLKSGNLSDIASFAKVVLNGPGKSSYGLKAILLINNLCCKTQVEKPPIIDDDILDMAILCCEAIRNDVEVNVITKIDSRAICSFNNILRLFLTKDKTPCVFKLLKCVVPLLEKITISAEDKQTVMTALVSISLNFVGSSIKNSQKRNNAQPLGVSLPESWDLVLRISSLATIDSLVPYIVASLTKLSIYFGKQHNSREEYKWLEWLHIKFAKFCESKHISPIKSGDILDKFFGNVVSLLLQLVHVGLTMRESLLLISKWVPVFLPKGSDHFECFSLISRVVKILIIDEDYVPDEKLFVSELKSFKCILEKFESEGLPEACKKVLFFNGNVVKSLNLTKAVAFKSLWTTDALSALQKFSKLTATLLLLSQNSMCVYATGQACPCNSDSVHAFNTIERFIRLCVHTKRKKEEWIDTWPMVQDSLELLKSIYNQASQKNCVGLQSMAEKLNISYADTGMLCFKTDDWEQCRNLLLPCLKYHCEASEDDNHAQKTLLSTVSKLSVVFEKLGSKSKAQAVILLHVILQIQRNVSKDYFCERWSSLQNDHPDKGINADEAVKREKSMFSSFSIDENLYCDLLLWEIHCYVAYRISHSEIILNAWVNLKNHNPSPLKLLQGLALTYQALFYAKDFVNWSDLLPAPLDSILSNVKPHEKGVALCSIAIFYRVKFLILCQKHFDQSESMVLEGPVYSTNPKNVKVPSDVVDPSDVCDVRSTFQNLNLKQEQDLMALLDTSVSYWKQSLEAGFNKEDCTLNPIVCVSGKYLLETAYFYSLWGFEAGAAKTFLICIDFSKKVGEDDVLLQAFSGLMNTLHVKDEVITEADAVSKRLKDHPNISYLSKVYCTSKAFQALQRREYEEGVHALKDVINFTPTSSTVWCLSYAKLLQASYGCLPDSLVDKAELGECDESSAIFGLMYSSNTVKKKRLSCNPLVFTAMSHQALSLSLWIGRYFLRRKRPREARCYLKAELSLALKMGLATRAVEFICELAFVDLLTENVNAVSTKLIDIESILGKGDSQSFINSMEDSEMELADQVTNVPQLVPPFVRELGQSPELGGSTVFYMPFYNHDSSCECYTCRNYSIKNLWLMYNHILAKIAMFRSNIRDSFVIYNETLKVALKVLQGVDQDSEFPGVLALQHQIACSLISLRLDFVDMLVVYKKDGEALRRCQRTIELLNKRNIHEPLLLAEALEQKVCLMIVMERDRDLDIECVKVPELQSKGKRLPLKTVKTECLTPVQNQVFLTPKSPINIPSYKWNDDSCTPCKSSNSVSTGSKNLSELIDLKPEVPKPRTVSKKPSDKVDTVSNAPQRVRSTRQATVKSKLQGSESSVSEKPNHKSQKLGEKKNEVNVRKVSSRQLSRQATKE